MKVKWFLLCVSLLLAGFIFLPRSLNFTPKELMGTWKTESPSHAERFLGLDFATDYPTALPDPIKVAVIMHVGTLYLHREASTSASLEDVPFGYKMLMSSYRVYPSA